MDLNKPMQNSALQKSNSWRIVGLIILSVRFVQGWIFWGGGSRRFIYAPEKLDPHSATWLANKLQSAMPGALLGAGNIISYLLQHFWMLYIALVAFSLLELLSGLGLILGFFTRFCAFLTALLSFSLMINFGWEGGTCMDEWTMAVSNFAIALVLILSGSPVYSIDAWLMKRYPSLRENELFNLLASGEWPEKTLKNIAIGFFILAIVFTTTTYNYYRGAIFSAYHAGKVSPRHFQLSLSNGRIARNGQVQFQIYVSGGTTAVPSYIMRIELQDANNHVVETWNAETLSALPQRFITNYYSYNKISSGPFGLVAPVSALAKITLAPVKELVITSNNYLLMIYLADGSKWSLQLNS